MGALPRVLAGVPNDIRNSTDDLNKTMSQGSLVAGQSPSRLSSIEVREVNRDSKLAHSQKLEKGQLRRQLHGMRKSADFGL